MNFLPTAFSLNGKPTILPKNPMVKMGRMGQRIKLSDQDIKLVNLVYKVSPIYLLKINTTK